MALGSKEKRGKWILLIVGENLLCSFNVLHEFYFRKLDKTQDCHNPDLLSPGRALVGEGRLPAVSLLSPVQNTTFLGWNMTCVTSGRLFVYFKKHPLLPIVSVFLSHKPQKGSNEAVPVLNETRNRWLRSSDREWLWPLKGTGQDCGRR